MTTAYDDAMRRGWDNWPGVCAEHGVPMGLTDPAAIARCIRLLTIGRENSLLRDDHNPGVIEEAA